MMNIHFREWNTSRLQLRRLSMEDLPLYYEKLAGSETVTRYMLWQPHHCIAESETSIQKALQRLEAGTSFRWAITTRSNGQLIGIIDLIPRDPELGICSFAYMLCENSWNQGYGTEALKAIIDFAFRECGVEIIEADHFADNFASGAVMRKVGMVYQHILPGKYEKNGQLFDACLYRIFRDDWLISSKEASFSDNS